MEALHAQGAFGAVYRAVSVDPAHPGPVALKVALSPWNARFGREAQPPLATVTLTPSQGA